jgi:branched-chain amino acid transport system substrate-binding protein
MCKRGRVNSTMDAGVVMTQRQWAAAKPFRVFGLLCLMATLLAACGSRVGTAAIQADSGSKVVTITKTDGSGSKANAAGTGAASNTSTTIASVSSGSGSSGTGGTANSGSGAVTSSKTAGTASSGAPATGSSATAAANRSTVVIGNIGTYSGIIGTIFAGVQQGLEVGVANLNAHGGLNGHPVKLVTQDDGGDPSTNETVAQTMVQSDGAIGFVSQFTPVSSSGSASFLSSHGIPVLGGDLYDPNWYSQPNWFPQGTNLEPGIAEAFLDMASKVGKEKLGVLYCIESPICESVGQYASAHPADGVAVVYTAPISLTQPSFTAQCIDAKNAGVDMLLVSADGASIERVASDCASQGISIELAEAAVAVSTAEETDSQVNGLVSALQDFPWFEDNTPATEAFHQAFATYLPSYAPDENSASAWTAVQLLALAGANLPASNPTAANLMSGADALGTTTIDGLSPSSITFHAGQPASGTNCFNFVEIVNGHWTAPDGSGPVCE